jgi:chromosome segregation ATPase
MMEQVEQLEQRVDGLIRLLEGAREENRQLRDHGEQQRRMIEELSGVRDANESLQQQIRRLEGELESMAQKEAQIRDRLRLILEKIDSMEHEISHGGAL